MSQDRHVKEITMEKLDNPDRKIAAGKIRKILLAGIVVLIMAGAGYAAYRVIAGDVRASRFAVNKMNCPACVVTVKEVTGKLPGVLEADVSLAGQEVTVTYREKQTSAEQIKNAITNAGYPVHIDAVFDPAIDGTDGPALVMVNGKPLFREDLHLPLGLSEFTPEKGDPAAHFFTTVGAAILLDAADERTVVVQPYEIEKQIEAFRKERGMSEEEFHSKAVKQYGSVEKLHQAVARKIAIRRLVWDYALTDVTETEEKKRQALAWIGPLFNSADVRILNPAFKEKLHAAAGDAEWKTFWPRMIGRDTDLKKALIE